MKLSVIVAAYNVENKIIRCLNSIKNQNIEDAEFIIVNDGSTDNTEKIIKNYIKKSHDKRFKLINKINGGLSDARNYGMKNSKGKYLLFIDADDYLMPNSSSLLNLVNEAEKLKLDLIEFNFNYINKDKKKNIAINLSNSSILTGQNLYLREVKQTNEFWFTVWHFMYKRDLIKENSLKFVENSMAEDNMWTPIVLNYTQKSKFINLNVYCYDYNPKSISHNQKNLLKRSYDSIYATKYLENNINFDTNVEFKSKIEQFISKLYIGSIIQLIVLNKNYIKRIDIIKFLFGKSISLKDFIKLIIILLPKKIRRCLCKIILNHSI